MLPTTPLLAAALLGSLCLGPRPQEGAPPQPARQAGDAHSDTLARAETLFAEGSFELARPLFEELAQADLDESTLRWVRFRAADCGWRSAAATRNPDPSRLDAARATLEAIVGAVERPGERERVWAEAEESLGDSYWAHQASSSFYQALPHYRNALDYWAGSEDLTLARERYLAIVWRMARPTWFQRGWEYGGYGAWVPVDVLESALRIADTAEDLAHARLLLARTLVAQAHGPQPARRARELFEALVDGSSEHEWYDDALYYHASWYQDSGPWVRTENGTLEPRPDWAAARRLFERLVSEFEEGESTWWRQAQQRIRHILAEEVAVHVQQVFLPGSKVRFRATWRNLDEVEFALYPISLLDDVHFDSKDSSQWDWVESVELGGRPAVQRWRRVTATGDAHRPGGAEVPIEASLAPGPYLLVARGGDVSARELLLVSDASLLVKASGTQLLLWATGAEDGVPIAGARARVHVRMRDPRGGAWSWSEYDGTTGDDGALMLSVAREPRDAAAAFATIEHEGRAALALLASPYVSAEDAWRIYATTDRPAYRPDQTVHWKVLARMQRGHDLRTPSGAELDYTITDPRGTELEAGSLTLSDFGSASGQLATDDTMPLGEYRVAFREPGSKRTLGTATLFRLEEYKLPEFRVTVDIPERDGQRPVYVLGDEVEARIGAEYYFGGPVAGAEVEILVHQRASIPDWRAPRRDGWFADALGVTDRPIPWGGPGQVIHQERLVTDEAGQALVRFATPHGDGGAGYDLEFTIEARVTDPSRREVVGSGRVRVSTQSYRAHAWVEHRIHPPGRSVSVCFAARDASGEPVSATGEARLLRARWVEVWLDPAGSEVSGPALARARTDQASFPAPGWSRLRAEYVLEEVARTPLALGEDGTGEWRVSPPREGSYVVRWTGPDPRSSDVTAEAWFWVASDATRDLGYWHDGVGIVLDESTFRAGDPGHLLIVTEASGRHVLFTVEAGGLLEWRVLRLDGTASLVTLDVDERLAPNAFLSATMVHGLSVHEDVQEVVVSPARRFLDVEVRGDRELYRPGQEGTLEVVVRDSTGAPVEAEVTLSVTDEAVSAIQSDYAGDPRAFFYGRRRGRDTSTASTFQHRPYRRLVAGADGELVDESLVPATRRGRAGEAQYEAAARLPGSSPPADKRQDAFEATVPLALADEVDAAGGASAGASSVVVRSDFRETALWGPAVVTGPDGRATVDVRFPDSTTRWRATARVCDRGARFGFESELAARTSMPLLVRLAAPRFFVVGDEATVSVLVTNNTDGPLAPLVDARLDGLELLGWLSGGELRPEPPEASAAALPAGGQRRVDLRVRATAPGTADIVVQAMAGDVGDAMARSLPVLEHGIEAWLSDSGKLDGPALELDFELPAARREGSTRMTVQVAPSIAVTMLDALPYLVHYPYGCIEQTLSRFVPATITARTLERLGVSPEVVAERSFGGIEAAHASSAHPEGSAAFAALAEVSRSGLARIESFQRPDGGFGWWPGGEPDTFMSAYAVWALVLARDAGLDVPEPVLARGREWLRKRIVEAEDAPDLAAWILYALCVGDGAAQGAPQGEPARAVRRAADRLFEDRARLSAYGRALLALAMHELGEAERATLLARNLANGVVRDETGGSRAGAGSSGRRQPTAHWGEEGPAGRWSADGVEATAFGLRALLAIDPGNELVDPAMTWLVNNRRGAQWKSTRDTAICVLALCDYLTVTGEATAPVGFELEINGELVARRTLEGDALLSGAATFLVDGPRAGANSIRLRRTQGEGPLYWSVGASFFSEEEPVPARGSELFVRRDYYRLVGRKTLLKGEVFERVPLADGDALVSGDRVEVVLTVEARNHLEYLILEDEKPACFETVEQTSGGPFYFHELRADELERRFGSASSPRVGARDATETAGFTGRTRFAYRELREERVALFLDRLPEGVWEAGYTLRTETPGTFHALPALGRAMYVPEIRCNGTEVRLTVEDAGGGS